MKFSIQAKYDVIILGSGISGLICALELAKHNKTIYLATKEAITESSSSYAQGGVAVPLNKFDSIEKHLEDTLNVGSGLSNAEVAKQIISNSSCALEKLISYGIKFDLDPKKTIHQTKEAAHSIARVCHAGGDSTGKHITKILIDKVCRENKISISQGTTALAIFKDDFGEASGVLVEDVTHNKYAIAAKDIIIATGGLGQLYKQTTNPQVSTGDGVAMSYRAGVTLQDIEMIQFHPTVLLEKGDPFLITEAIRGEGGKLKNINGEYFASRYHNMAELAPRDVLSRGIYYELEKTKSQHIYLDINNFKQAYFVNRFPTIYEICKERKIDLFNTGIPVSPAAHYFIGGVKCDISGKTNIKGLRVIGEVSSNGCHGANRLASNSLLECIVVPYFLVENLLQGENSKLLAFDTIEINMDETSYSDNELQELRYELQAKNTENIGLIKSGQTLGHYLDWLYKLSEKFNVYLPSIYPHVQELKNMLLLATLICETSVKRNHSLGVHFRQDFQELPSKPKHSIFSLEKGLSWEIEALKEPVTP